MSHRPNALIAVAVCVLSFAALPAPAAVVTYDFSTVAGTGNGDGALVPTTLQGATFSSSAGAGAYQFGPNAGLYTNLGAYTLSAAGTPAPLSIAFATPQNGLSFDFALGDFFASGGSDTLTLTTNTGFSETVTAAPVGSDLFPEGLFNLTGASPFSSVSINSVYAVTLADLTSTSGTAPVPLPGALLLFASGLAGLGWRRGRKTA